MGQTGIKGPGASIARFIWARGFSEAHRWGLMVQSIDRAISLLDALSEAEGPQALRDLGRAAEVPSTTARRLLLTLISHRFVTQDEETRLYSRGPRLFESAYRIMGNLDLRTQAGPTLDRLNRETGLTVHLAILAEGEVVYIDKREANEPVRMYSAVGKRAPVHCTALGKALIAYLHEEELRKIVKAKGLARYTENTITTWKRLREHLTRVRERGFSQDRAEQQDRIYCIGAAIRDDSGKVVGSISLTGAVYSHEISQLERLAPVLMQAAEEISGRLGYVAPMGEGRCGHRT
jgi:IclR family KDG regulon transcriptional repressor